MTAITIVTICFNEEKNIARTIQSVLNQSATDYEYVICDGVSKDRTIEIAESFREKFAQKGISYRIYSEKDKGIYDAMNKGIGHAQGQYIWFLNAGDWLCEDYVLARFTEAIREDASPAVYYADYYYVHQHRAIFTACDDTSLPQRMSVGHPALAARTDLMRQTHFDTQYRIAADYNFVLGLKMQDMQFRHLGIVSTYFLEGGISNEAESTNVDLRRIHEHYGLPHEDIADQPLTCKEWIKGTLVRISPAWLWRFYTEKVKHKKWIEY